MRFTASLALAAAAVVPAAIAQSVTINATPLTQCATSAITFGGSTGPYYVAIVPASDPCTEDAIAEFYDVESGEQDYYVNLPSGTSVQIYLMDVNGVENWSQIYTVGDGDNSCLGGSGAAAAQAPSSSDPAPSDPATTSVPPPATTSTTDAVTTSSTSAPALYVPPSPSTTAAALTHSNTNSGSTNTGSTDTGSTDTGSTTNNSGSDVAPANAASDSANGASSLSACVTLLVGAFAAVVALF